MSTNLSYLNITNRNVIDIKGVVDVLSYDCDKVVLQMEDCNLIIGGTGFNVKKLDVENRVASIVGHVDSIVFSTCESKSPGRFLSNLFK